MILAISYRLYRIGELCMLVISVTLGTRLTSYRSNLIGPIDFCFKAHTSSNSDLTGSERAWKEMPQVHGTLGIFTGKILKPVSPFFMADVARMACSFLRPDS